MMKRVTKSVLSLLLLIALLAIPAIHIVQADEDLDAEAYCATCQQAYDEGINNCQPYPEDCEDTLLRERLMCEQERCNK